MGGIPCCSRNCRIIMMQRKCICGLCSGGQAKGIFEAKSARVHVRLSGGACYALVKASRDIPSQHQEVFQHWRHPQRINDDLDKIRRESSLNPWCHSAKKVFLQGSAVARNGIVRRLACSSISTRSQPLCHCDSPQRQQITSAGIFFPSLNAKLPLPPSRPDRFTACTNIYQTALRCAISISSRLLSTVDIDDSMLRIIACMFP